MLSLPQALVSLAHLRAGQATAVQRDVQLQTDGTLRNVATEGTPSRRTVGKAQAVVVALLITGHGIQGRRMAGLALPQVLFGSRHCIQTGLQVEVLRRRRIDPGLGIVRRWRQHWQAVHDPFDRHVIAVGQGHQRFEGIIHRALGEQAVGARGIETGLRFEHVGLVGQTDVETFIGLIQLTLECSLFGPGRGQVVLRTQHAEVGFGTLQDQVLLGRRQLQCGLLTGRFGGLQLEPAISAEQRLTEIGLVDQTTARTGGARRVDFRTCIAIVGPGRQVGQQTGTRLRHDFATRLVIGTRGGDIGVVISSLPVNADQIDSRMGGRQLSPY